MLRNKNKFAIFLLLAALSFTGFSLGGEFLHNKIHHHSDQASHDACPVYQLQTRSSIVVFALILALFATFKTYAAQAHKVFFAQSYLDFPHLRGAPDDAGTTLEEFAQVPALGLVDQNGALRGFWTTTEIGRGNLINAARLLAKKGPRP